MHQTAYMFLHMFLKQILMCRMFCRLKNKFTQNYERLLKNRKNSLGFLKITFIIFIFKKTCVFKKGKNFPCIMKGSNKSLLSFSLLMLSFSLFRHYFILKTIIVLVAILTKSTITSFITFTYLTSTT